MSTVHDIPTEVVQEIFLFAISDRIREPDGRRAPIPYSCHPTYSSSTSPYSITHVCKRWKDISINLPNLWTYLSIENPKSLNLVPLFKEWINRSCSLPLHLALHEFPESDASQQYREVTKAVLSLFLESFHRCKTFVLDIEMPLDDLIDAGHIETQHPASLDCVSLWILEASSLASRMFLFNLLRGTSALLSISILVPIRLQHISTSWDNLQHLIFYESDYAEYELPKLLSHCRHLKTLEAYSLFLGTPEQEIALPHLQRMTLQCMNAVSMFLMSLKVPALSGLILDCYHTLNGFSIVEMLTKSGATLKSLEINGLVPGDIGVVSMLTASCFAGLETLRLTDMPMPGYIAGPGRSNTVWLQVIALLITSDSTTWRYLPHLRHFSLVTQNTDELNPAHLEVVAQSRLFVRDPEIIRKHSSLEASSGSINFSFTIPLNFGRENHSYLDPSP